MASNVLNAGAVTAEQCADLIEESSVEQCVDLGHSLLYTLKHPTFGRIVLMNSSSGPSGVMPV